MTTAVEPIVGTYEVDPVHSRVGFAVVHMGLSTFRSVFTDLDGRLVADGVGVTLTACARVGSSRSTTPGVPRARRPQPGLPRGRRVPGGWVPLDRDRAA